MPRFSYWQVLAVFAGVGFFAMGLLAIFEPPLPGRWCKDNSVWRVCYRDWLGALAGWAAIIAAALALAATRQQIGQAAEIAERQHRHSMRVVNEPILRALVALITRVQSMIDRGEGGQKMMLQRNSDYTYEFLIDDLELKRLERIAAFKTVRDQARREMQKWRGAAAPSAMASLQRLVALLNEVYRRLHQGEDLDAIAAAMDKPSDCTNDPAAGKLSPA